MCQYLNHLFPNLIDLDRFNVRRRELVWLIEAIRRDLRNQIIDPQDRVWIVDSVPITLMTHTATGEFKC